ncbi:MAG: type II toxin-antitoxin system YafQ family toxin [Candidatus Wallbacteria bacterium]|nr:type II toxin-antitoxin system YafQ family toxin [Candidatus Wallbacteria bacterium]
MSSTPLLLVFGKQFKKDFRLAKKSGKDTDRLFKVLELLQNGKKLPERYRAHKLRGLYREWCELHIEPDWLLIYKVEGQFLKLARIGTHGELFDL